MLIKTVIVTIIALLCILPSSNVQESLLFVKLMQIVPLYSTEADVERLYGKPVKQYAKTKEYKSEVGILTVTYSDGVCDPNKSSDYNTESGKVIEAYLSFDKVLTVEKLGVDLNKFKKSIDGDAVGVLLYENKELGVKIDTYKERVGNVYIFPSKLYSAQVCQPTKVFSAQSEPIQDSINEWLTKLEQLKLLQSSREQVYPFFNKPTSSQNEYVDVYIQGSTSLSFVYSTGRCGLKVYDEWKVAEGTLIAFHIFSLDGIPKEIFKVDPTVLSKTPQKLILSNFKGAYNVELNIVNKKILSATLLPFNGDTDSRCVAK